VRNTRSTITAALPPTVPLLVVVVVVVHLLGRAGELWDPMTKIPYP